MDNWIVDCSNLLAVLEVVLRRLAAERKVDYYTSVDQTYSMNSLKRDSEVGWMERLPKKLILRFADPAKNRAAAVLLSALSPLSPTTMSKVRVLYWFRTDLRLHDSPALKAALDLNPSSLFPVWCWDPEASNSGLSRNCLAFSPRI